MKWCCVFLLMVAVSVSEALVWSLVLGNPIVDGAPSEEASSSSPFSFDRQQDDTDDIQHPRNTKRITSSRPTRHHHGQDKCMEDRQCGKGRFCDTHYGVCRAEKSPGFACRRDRMCAKGLHCMYGRCQAKINTGEEGSRCHGDQDCQPGHCCARRHGEAVCQPKLSLAQRCYVPDGGLEYSLNQLCPCDVGLVCQQSGPPTPDDASFDRPINATNAESFPFWTSTDNMRCQPHDMAHHNRAI